MGAGQAKKVIKSGKKLLLSLKINRRELKKKKQLKNQNIV